MKRFDGVNIRGDEECESVFSGNAEVLINFKGR